MGKIFCAFLFVMWLLFAGEAYIGHWSFIFYEKANSFDRLMPPPIFNEVEFKEDGMAHVKVRSKDMAFDVRYLVNEKYIGMKLPLKGAHEEPVRFKAEYAYSDKDGTLAIKGTDSSAVYVRTESLLPLHKLVGTWRNDGKFTEYIEILANGLMKLKVTGLTGFCVLWKDNAGMENLTMVGGIRNAMPHTFIWQVEIKDGKLLEMTPVTDQGPQKNKTTTWHRISN
ncbi:MAG: hypothetical protein IJS08_09985 [Victivallales bacterium]|nr:hypothetical protein [Victivallales bacterium]